MERPNRALIAPDIEASGIWLVSVRADEDRRPWIDRLGGRLTTDLKVWNDSAEACLDRRVQSEARKRRAEVEFYAQAAALASQVQARLGAGWEVLWMDGANQCWTWIDRPASWKH